MGTFILRVCCIRDDYMALCNVCDLTLTLLIQYPEVIPVPYIYTEGIYVVATLLIIKFTSFTFHGKDISKP